MKTLNLLALGVLSLATALTAQGLPGLPPSSGIQPGQVALPVSMNGAFNRSVGNSTLGCGVSATASLIGTATNVAANMLLTGNINLFGGSYEAARFSGSATSNTSTNANLNLRLAGQSVWSRSFNYSQNHAFSTTRSISRSQNYMLGPIPVTVQGTVGVSGNLNIQTGLNAVQRTINFTGTARGWAFGSASAGVSFSSEYASLSAGVIATMNFADQTMNGILAVGTNGSNGLLSYNLIPISLSLGLYATASINYFVGTWSESWTMNLVNFTAPAFSTGNMMF